MAAPSCRSTATRPASSTTPAPLPADAVPTDLDALLAWAKANPGKFIVTSPAGGGSGSGFMQSIAFAKVTDDACRATFTKYAITKDEADAYAASDCLAPVWNYYTRAAAGRRKSPPAIPIR